MPAHASCNAQQHAGKQVRRFGGGMSFLGLLRDYECLSSVVVGAAAFVATCVTSGARSQHAPRAARRSVRQDSAGALHARHCGHGTGPLWAWHRATPRRIACPPRHGVPARSSRPRRSRAGAAAAAGGRGTRPACGGRTAPSPTNKHTAASKARRGPYTDWDYQYRYCDYQYPYCDYQYPYCDYQYPCCDYLCNSKPKRTASSKVRRGGPRPGFLPRAARRAYPHE